MVRMLTRRDVVKSTGAGLAGAAMLGTMGREGFARQDAEPVTITFWHYYGGGTTVALEGLLQRYMDAHPNVTIEPRLINFSDFNRTLLQGAAAGDLPDIALVNAFDTTLLAESGIIENLTERVKPGAAPTSTSPASMRRVCGTARTTGCPTSSTATSSGTTTDQLRRGGGRTAADLGGTFRHRRHAQWRQPLRVGRQRRRRGRGRHRLHHPAPGRRRRGDRAHQRGGCRGAAAMGRSGRRQAACPPVSWAGSRTTSPPSSAPGRRR